MAFVKDEKYYQRKVANIKAAIEGQEKDLKHAIASGNQSAIDAQSSYLQHLRSELKVWG